MADHARVQVVAAAVADLTGLATTGANVFTDRVRPTKPGEMPCLLLAIRSESSDHDIMGATPAIVRTGQLTIEGWAYGEDGLEALLNTLAAEIEAGLYGATPELDDVLMNIGTPTTTIEILEPDDGVARRMGIARLIVPVMYRTAAADPTTII